MWFTLIQHILCGSPGRPAFNIPRQVLERFVENSFNVSAMVSVLKVSESTVKKTTLKNEMSIYSQYPNLSEVDLDAMAMDIIQQVSNSGYKHMIANFFVRR